MGDLDYGTGGELRIPLGGGVDAVVRTVGPQISALAFAAPGSEAPLDPGPIGARVLDAGAGEYVPCYPERTFLLFCLARYRVEIDGSPRLEVTPHLGHRFAHP